MTQTRSREHAGRPSSFSYFLEDEAVNTRLKANLIRYCAPVNVEMLGVGTLSRCFNDLPRLYFGFQPLLDSVIEAVKNHETDIWVYFALAVAMDDLLDENGELRREIHEAMNYRHMLDYLTDSYTRDTVKQEILRSYIHMLYEFVLKLTPLTQRRNAQNPDEDHAIRLSRAISQFLDSLDGQAVDHSFIACVNSTLRKAGSNPSLVSKSLQNHILNFNYGKLRRDMVEDTLTEREKEISRLKDEIARMKASHRSLERSHLPISSAGLFTSPRFNP